MRLTALVPMKGHSERVPGKNLRPCAGRPLFEWVIDSLLAAERVDRVVVDTDSRSIETAVRSTFPEVDVVHRPEHLHGDLVAMHDIVAHLADVLDADAFLQTHCTNPLLGPATIDRAVAAFEARGSHDSLMSVTPLRTRFYREDGSPVNHDPAVLLRTQDLEPIHEENSCIYIAPRALIRATRRRVGPNPLLFPIDRREAVDIDEELDFLIAEHLLEMAYA